MLAVVLAAISLATSWWTATAVQTNNADPNAASTTLTLQFYPGTAPQGSCSESQSSFSETCDQNLPALSYTNDGLSSLGAYYILAQVTALLAVVLGAICSVFMFLGAGHRLWGRWHFHTTHLLALIVGVLLILSPMLLVLFQPSLVGSANSSSYESDVLSGAENSCGSNTPNASFWDSCSYTEGQYGYSVSWGAGWGWYLALGSALAFLLGGGIFLSSRDDERDEEATGASGYPVRNAYRPSPYGEAPPGLFGGSNPGEMGVPPSARTVPLDYQGVATMQSRNVCPRCGHLNNPGAALCSRCHATLA